MDLSILLQDHQLYHSEFQQDHFITRRAGGTLYGQYKQSLRELFKRFRGLKELYYSKEELIINMEELEQKLIPEEEDEFERRRLELKLGKNKYDMIELNKNIQDTEREFKRFYQQAYSLKQNPAIGELTDEKRKVLDQDMWAFKLKEMAYLDLLTTNRVGKNTLEFINALDKPRRFELLGMVQQGNGQAQLMQWYENKDEEYELLPVEVNVAKMVVSNSDNTKLLG